MGQVTTSITINFQTADGDTTSVLNAEVDGREDGFNVGRTSFLPGDSPVFLIYKTSNVIVDVIQSSEGSISQIGTGQVTEEQWLTFAYEKEASLSKPAAGSLTIAYTTGPTPRVESQTKAVLDAEAVAAVKVTYGVDFLAYKVTGASGNAPLVVYIAGHTA